MMSSRKLGVTVMLLSLLALVGTVWTGIERANTARCQARVNDALITSQRARATAADQDREALDTMVATVAEATARAQVQAALNKYRADRAASNESRRRNPLPEPASEVCG
jgi:hypothetical protein